MPRLRSLVSYLTLISIAIAALAMSALPAHAQQKITSTKTQCPLFHPTDDMFADLKRVALFLDFQPRYVGAFKCHEHEELCAPNAGRGISYLQEAREDYKRYPKALLPEKVAKVFRDELTTKFSRILPKDGQCKIPEVPILDWRAMDNIGTATDTLIINVKVDIFPKANLPVAILSSTKFRPGCLGKPEFTGEAARQTLPIVKAIPLKATQAAMEKELIKFAYEAIPLMTFAEDITP